MVDESKYWRLVGRGNRFGDLSTGFGWVGQDGDDLEAFDLAAEEPRPKRMGEFVAEDVNEHWLGQKQEHHPPAGRAPKERDPETVRAARGSDDHHQGADGSGAKRQEQDGDNGLEPRRHGGVVSAVTPLVSIRPTTS